MRGTWTFAPGSKGRRRSIFEEGGESEKIVEWVTAEKQQVMKMGNGGMKKERKSDVASKNPFDVLVEELHLHWQQG